MKIITFLLLIFSHPLLAATEATTILKDISSIKGVRNNPLIGYGLVIGLNGTGDGGGEITSNSLKRMFQKLGLNPQQEISSKNVAAVIVTAKLPPFARQGQKIDVTISSIGDSSSLAGGTLLITPLKGGDGEIYAVANGQISIGGLGQGSRFPTVGRIPNGGLVEKELKLDFHKKKSIRISLNNPDFTTAARVEKTLNTKLGGLFAHAKDASTIDLLIPPFYSRKIVQLLATIENFPVHTQTKAKIVINERTGTIVAGGAVSLKPAAISHGNLTIQVGGEKEGGGNRVYMLENGGTLNELVKALNAFGTTPEDLVSIFQALKDNGSLIGDLSFI